MYVEHAIRMIFGGYYKIQNAVRYTRDDGNRSPSVMRYPRPPSNEPRWSECGTHGC